MVSSEMESIRKGLFELHCSVSQFAAIAKWPQPRLSELFRGTREPAYHEAALLRKTLERMQQLADDVRADTGNVQIVWSPSIRDVLETRHVLREREASGEGAASEATSAPISGPLRATGLQGE